MALKEPMGPLPLQASMVQGDSSYYREINSPSYRYMWIAIALFILLSPGLLITIPPIGKMFMSGKTSLVAIIIHAAIFAILLSVFKSVKEGFENTTVMHPEFHPNESAELLNKAIYHSDPSTYPEGEGAKERAYYEQIRMACDKVNNSNGDQIALDEWKRSLESMTPPDMIRAAHGNLLALLYGFGPSSGYPGDRCTRDIDPNSQGVEPSGSMCKYYCTSGYGESMEGEWYCGGGPSMPQ